MNRRHGLVIGLVLGAVLLLGACVGSISDSALRDEIRARGGGLGSSTALEAIDELQGHFGTDDLVLTRFEAHLEFVELSVVVSRRGELAERLLDELATGADPATVSPADLADGVDRYRYGTSGLFGAGGLSGPAAERLPDPLVTSFLASQVAFDRLDEVVDEALALARAEGAVDGGWADEVTVVRPGEGGPRIEVVVDDGRRDATVLFRANGELIRLQPS